MNRKSIYTIMPIAALALAGCANTERDSSAESRAPAAVAVGEPQSCIPLQSIRTTRVHDDRTIDFEMSGDTVYRNTLPYSCGGLGFEQRITYRTSGSQLCSTDTFRVLYSDGQTGASCGFGKFVPVRLEK